MAKKLHLIKEVLQEGNKSGYWLAKETGISYNSINGYINGKIEPSLTNLVRIADVLGVDVRELVIPTKLR
jgi:putative transcriptional regulator